MRYDPADHRPISERLRDRCYRCDGTRRIEKRTTFPATKYSAAGVVIDSAPCPQCAAAPQAEQFHGATIDGVLRREGDAWTTTDPRHGIIAHTLKIATGAECAPADCVSCARGSCLVEVQECDAWDARVIVHDPGRDDRA